MLERGKVDLASDYDAILAMHRASLIINFGAVDLSERVLQKSLTEALDRGNVYAYRADNVLYGWLWLAYLSESRAHVRQIEVRRKYWGQGVGKCMMRDAIAMAMEHGCSEMTLNVTKSNQRAVGLYTGLGFVATEDKGARQLMRLDLRQLVSSGQCCQQSQSRLGR